MFSNYQNITNNYTPNNTHCSFPVGQSYTKLNPIKESKPYEEYNVKGELIGYSWPQGEILNLEFVIDGVITVEDSAIVLTAHGDVPSDTTGALGARAYNVTDLKSWTCKNIIDGKFLWIEDAEFTYNDSCSRSIYVTSDDYMKDKKIRVDIYNFRKEIIHSQLFEGSNRVKLIIDENLTKIMTRGIYSCSMTVIGDNLSTKLFDSSDCVLLVK